MGAFVLHMNFQGVPFENFSRFLNKREQEALLFLCPKKRAGFVFSRLLLKILLKDKAHLEEEEQILSFDEHSKPYLFSRPDIFINLSHTKIAAAAALSALPVGVDVEAYRPLSEKLKERFFTSDEREYILKSGDSLSSAVEIWTKKEAYSKMEGRGLSLPFSSFSSLSKGELIFSKRERGYFLSVCTKRPARVLLEEMNASALFGYFSGEFVPKKD